MNAKCACGHVRDHHVIVAGKRTICAAQSCECRKYRKGMPDGAIAVLPVPLRGSVRGQRT